MTDLAITPDFTKLVAIGMYDSVSPPPPVGNGAAGAGEGAGAGVGTATPPTGPTAPANGNRPTENRIIVYDLVTKQLETYVLTFPLPSFFWPMAALRVVCSGALIPNPWMRYRSVRMEGELTSVKVSQDSRYALINRALDAVTVLSVRAMRLPRL